MRYFESWDTFWPLLREMLGGSLVTLEIWAMTLLCALPLGLLLCLLGISKFRPLRTLTTWYIFLFRGTPLLLQVMVVFFGIPLLFPGFTLPRMTAAIIAFILNYTAYFAEIYRGGIQSIPRGQYEAAHVLGLSNRVTFTKIILPQVAKRILPPMGNEIITLVKDTALVYVIAINELLREAKIAMLRDFSFMPMIIAAVFYLVMTGGLTKLFSYFERKLSYYR